MLIMLFFKNTRKVLEIWWKYTKYIKLPKLRYRCIFWWYIYVWSARLGINHKFDTQNARKELVIKYIKPRAQCESHFDIYIRWRELCENNTISRGDDIHPDRTVWKSSLGDFCLRCLVEMGAWQRWYYICGFVRRCYSDQHVCSHFKTKASSSDRIWQRWTPQDCQIPTCTVHCVYLCVFWFSILHEVFVQCCLARCYSWATYFLRPAQVSEHLNQTDALRSISQITTNNRRSYRFPII